MYERMKETLEQVGAVSGDGCVWEHWPDAHRFVTR
jgi:hypothetical protein